MDNKPIPASALLPNDEQIEQAIRTARQSWQDWREAFEHEGPIRENPILANPDLFNRFCFGWRVGRTIRKGTREQLRRTLLDSAEFADAIADNTGQKLGNFENSLRAQFGTRAGGSSLLSAISKLAAFLRPERFVPWDQFAKAGVNVVSGRPPSGRFESYAIYLAEFERIWDGPHGQKIREMMKNHAQAPVESDPRFQRRVLDLYLMTKGSYKPRA